MKRMPVRSAVLQAIMLVAILGCSPSEPPPTPKKRLQAELRELEYSVHAGEYTLKQSAIEIKQKRENMKYEVAKAINEARAYGMDVETVRTQTIAELTDDLKISIEVHKVQMQMLKDDRKKLEQKQKELQQDGEANGSQPIGSETNRASSAADSHR